MARAELNLRGPSLSEYKMMIGDMIPGRVDKNGDVGFYKDPGENKERIGDALAKEWPTISSYLTYSEEDGGL